MHRIDPKHYRWYQEITEGGSLLLFRPGVSALHKGPDGLSRNCEGRDWLILAKDSEWKEYRNRIRGICDAIAQGLADDDEPEALTIEKISKEDPKRLEPMPYAQGLAASQNYEKKSQERKYCQSARGEKSSTAEGKGKAKSKAKAKAKPKQSRSHQAKNEHAKRVHR